MLQTIKLNIGKREKKVRLTPDLFVNECNTTNLLNDGFGCRPVVDEVGRDGDGQFPAEFFSLETFWGSIFFTIVL